MNCNALMSTTTAMRRWSSQSRRMATKSFLFVATLGGDDGWARDHPTSLLTTSSMDYYLSHQTVYAFCLFFITKGSKKNPPTHHRNGCLLPWLIYRETTTKCQGSLWRGSATILHSVRKSPAPMAAAWAPPSMAAMAFTHSCWLN